MALILSVALWLSFPAEALAFRMVDYQRRLNPRFRRQVRPETRFIIIHSTESSLPSGLRTLSRGKTRRGRYITQGGHAHYLVAKNGTVYRILDPKYWANHAGVSMWEGLEDLSDYSIGIELEGYHNVPFSGRQYASLKKLIKQLQKRYGIDDRNVLEHYRVAYSPPNRYHGASLRGRKLDPGIDNFDRRKAGLIDEYPDDPDVIAGRIGGEPAMMRAGGQLPPAEELEEEADLGVTGTDDGSTNLITAQRTAWQIAGLQYNAPTTVYQFPDGRLVTGDQMRDWTDIPAGTKVELDVAIEKPQKVVSRTKTEVILPEISATQSPWKIANALYASSITFYLFPDGKIQSGSTISRFSAVPNGTRVLVAYREMSKPETSSALGEDLEDAYLAPNTLYLFPGPKVRSGDQIEDFTRLPGEIRVFRKVE
jgi:hypothetical protein